MLFYFLFVGGALCWLPVVPFAAKLAISSIVPAGLMIYNYIDCLSYECCNDRWISRNETALRQALKDNVYGQPFATKILLNAIGNHWSRSQERQKPLVMMLHGPTGVGKSYITRMLAKTMFTNGCDSAFVQFFTSSYHFTSEQLINQHVSDLQSWIEGNATLCDEQLYVFDEARRFPIGLLDGLAPFFSPGNPFARKLRNSVFVFLYEGDDPVVDWAVELFREGIDRESISLLKAEEKIMPYIIEEESAMEDSVLVKQGLIDYHLPLLPLERKHIRKCIFDAIKKNGAHLKPRLFGFENIEDMIDVIEKDTMFFPDDMPVFAAFGCKKIEAKVNSEFYIMDEPEL